MNGPSLLVYIGPCSPGSGDIPSTSYCSDVVTDPVATHIPALGFLGAHVSRGNPHSWSGIPGRSGQSWQRTFTLSTGLNEPTICYSLHSQTAVTAYLKNKQLLPSGSARYSVTKWEPVSVEIHEMFVFIFRILNVTTWNDRGVWPPPPPPVEMEQPCWFKRAMALLNQQVCFILTGGLLPLNLKHMYCFPCEISMSQIMQPFRKIVNFLFRPSFQTCSSSSRYAQLATCDQTRTITLNVISGFRAYEIGTPMSYVP